MEIKIFDEAINRGLQEIINEQNRNYCRRLRDEIMALIESKADEKLILKKIVDILNDRYCTTYYDPRGW